MTGGEKRKVNKYGMRLMRGGNANIFGSFIPKLGEASHFDSYFSKGLKPPGSLDSAIFVVKTSL